MLRFLCLAVLAASLTACGVKSPPVHKNKTTGEVSTRNVYPPLPPVAGNVNGTPEL